MFVAASVLLAQYGSNAVLKKVRAVAHVVEHENGKRQDFGMDHEVLDKTVMRPRARKHMFAG